MLSNKSECLQMNVSIELPRLLHRLLWHIYCALLVSAAMARARLKVTREDAARGLDPPMQIKYQLPPGRLIVLTGYRSRF